MNKSFNRSRTLKTRLIERIQVDLFWFGIGAPAKILQRAEVESIIISQKQHLSVHLLVSNYLWDSDQVVRSYAISNALLWILVKTYIPILESGDKVGISAHCCIQIRRNI